MQRTNICIKLSLVVRLSPIEFLNPRKCETNKAKLFRKLLDINDVYLNLLGDRLQHKLVLLEAEYRWTVLLGLSLSARL